jgi:hypothetical protein
MLKHLSASLGIAAIFITSTALAIERSESRLGLGHKRALTVADRPERLLTRNGLERAASTFRYSIPVRPSSTQRARYFGLCRLRSRHIRRCKTA